VAGLLRTLKCPNTYSNDVRNRTDRTPCVDDGRFVAQHFLPLLSRCASQAGSSRREQLASLQPFHSDKQALHHLRELVELMASYGVTCR